MPEDAPKIKQLNTRMLGAEVVLYNRYREDREELAADIAAKRGAALAPAFDHEDIIAGQGTVGLELAAAARERRLELECAYLPCGGGGLVAGSGLSIKDAYPDCRLFSVEPESYDSMKRSLEAGCRQVISNHARTSCDALMAPTPGAITFAINRSQLAGALTVTDAQAAHAMAFAARYLKLVLEPSGAVALAAVLSGAARDCACVGVVLSGGNVDPEVLISALREYPDP